MKKLFKKRSDFMKAICIAACGVVFSVALFYTTGIAMDLHTTESTVSTEFSDVSKPQRIDTSVLEMDSPLMERIDEVIERGTTSNANDDYNEPSTEMTSTTETVEPDVTDATVEITEGEQNTSHTEYENVNENSDESEDMSGAKSGDNTAEYAGYLNIPSVGVSVKCYAGSSQASVDASNSAAYYYGYGHTVIADHANQSFAGLKYCVVGTKAYFTTSNGSTEYTCVGVVKGHNTGYELTDANYNSIRNLYPGTIVCYTCTGNWQNIIMVFFGIPGADMDDATDENDADSEIYYVEDKAHCSAGTHSWELVDSFAYWDIVDGYRIKYSREHYVCSVCESDWLKTEEIERMTEEEYWGKEEVAESPDPLPTELAPEPPEEEKETIETEPSEAEPSEAEPGETEPSEAEPSEAEPCETEPSETEPIESDSIETGAA